MDTGELLTGAVLPDGKGFNALLPASLAAVGLSIPDFTAPTLAVSLPSAKQVCLIVVDGLGYQQLQDYRGHIPTLRSLGIDNYIHSVAPTTTSTALTALGTAALAGSSAVGGYTLRSPVNNKVFNLINWEGVQMPVENWQIQPTIFERLKTQVVDTCLIQPAKYVNSGLTRAAFRGAPYQIVMGAKQELISAQRVLSTGVKFVYVHWKYLDAAGHKYGVSSAQWLAELEIFDGLLKEFLRTVPKDTLVVVSADHGMIDAGEKIDLADSKILDKDVQEVAGEERALHIYTDYPAELANRWRTTVGDKAWVLTQAELATSAICGDLLPFARKVLGDVVVFAKDNYGFVDSRRLSSAALNLRGVHGSLTAAEVLVPLVGEVK